MARELIQLYAERQRRPGFAFPPDDEMQRQFESAFEYEERMGKIRRLRKSSGIWKRRGRWKDFSVET